MSESSNQRSSEFLKISGQFKLGALVTESSHPVTADLSAVAKENIEQALDLLFLVDEDVIRKFREFVKSGRAGEIARRVLQALNAGGRIFFTGCGSTGRLSIQLVSIWRDFWQQQIGNGLVEAGHAKNFENRAFSVMAGGDFALIKSVEGFEDFSAFGKKQIADLGVSGKDVVFAITEGGETSFVIGTAWQGVEAGAKVYFVYNNPDEILRTLVQRSREVIDDPRIEKLNLTTGPMAITGSTRMQATSIQLCAMLTILEIVVRELVQTATAGQMGNGVGETPFAGRSDPSSVPGEFLEKLVQMHMGLRSPEVLRPLAKLVALEESIYRSGHKNNYYADRFGIDVLTDTTERSPTYCTPPFRKFDDATAAESWAFLFVPDAETPDAWQRILKREPQCVEWTENETRELVGLEKFAQTNQTIRRISRAELMRFKIGQDGKQHRLLRSGDSAIGIVSETESASFFAPGGWHRAQLESAANSGAKLGLIYFGNFRGKSNLFPSTMNAEVIVPVPTSGLLLDGVTRVGVKMLLNALSTCTMVRLGRVMGNYMIWVVASNLKLIDRATRYIQKLTKLPYDDANRLLFEVVEYIEPRLKADQAYPPVVGLAVMRARYQVSNQEAERRLIAELA